MDNSLFKKLLLPGILVACATFSGLIFTLASRQSTLFSVEVVPSQEGSIQRLLSNERKEFAIRHVGLSIILSVISGMATIEMLRRWYAFQMNLQEKLQQFEATQHFATVEATPYGYLEEIAPTSFLAADVFVADFEGAANSPDINLDPAQTSVLANALDVAMAPNTQPTDWSEVAVLHPTILSPVTSNSAASHSQTAGVLAEHSSPNQIAPQSIAQDLTMPILELQPPYQAHRITLPGSPHYQFAILFDDQSYCLTKLEKKRENALKVAAMLIELNKRVVLTSTKRGYAIWTWQADANQKFIL